MGHWYKLDPTLRYSPSFLLGSQMLGNMLVMSVSALIMNLGYIQPTQPASSFQSMLMVYTSMTTDV